MHFISSSCLTVEFLAQSRVRLVTANCFALSLTWGREHHGSQCWEHCPTVRCLCISIWIAIIKEREKEFGQGVKGLEPLCIAGGKYKMVPFLWNRLQPFLRKLNIKFTLWSSNLTPRNICQRTENSDSNRYLYTSVHNITALFTIAPRKCPPTDE